MSIYENYVAPGVKYLTYISFLATVLILGLQLSKIYRSECRVMVFDALAKPFIPGMIFAILFFWKEINEFVSRSVLVKPDAPDTKKAPTPAPAPAPAPGDE